MILINHNDGKNEKDVYLIVFFFVLFRRESPNTITFQKNNVIYLKRQVWVCISKTSVYMCVCLCVKWREKKEKKYVIKFKKSVDEPSDYKEEIKNYIEIFSFFFIHIHTFLCPSCHIALLVYAHIQMTIICSQKKKNNFILKQN